MKYVLCKPSTLSEDVVYVYLLYRKDEGRQLVLASGTVLYNQTLLVEIKGSYFISIVLYSETSSCNVKLIITLLISMIFKFHVIKNKRC